MKQENKCKCGKNCDCKNKKIINKNMKIQEVIRINTDAAEILYELGLGCVGCIMARVETLEQGCKSHGMSDKEIDKVVSLLNV